MFRRVVGVLLRVGATAAITLGTAAGIATGLTAGVTAGVTVVLALPLAVARAQTVAPAQAATQLHVVVSGDTLYALALRYDTSVAELRRLNRLPDNVLRIGTRLQVPAPAPIVGYRTVTAEAGETLQDVADRFGLSPGSLRSANPGVLTNADLAGGAVLVPPADGVTVRVGPSDTLLGLSLAAGAAPGDVARLNDLGPDLKLTAGAPLLLPVAVGDGGPPDAVGAGAATVGGTMAVAAAGRPGDVDAAPATRAGSVAAAASAGYTSATASTASSATTSAAMSATTSTATAAATSPAASGAAPRPAPTALTRSAARSELRRLQELALRDSLGDLASLPAKSTTFAAPLTGRITSTFGWRSLTVNGNHQHYGVDVAANTGTAVRAARDGLVTKAGWGGSYGNVVYLDHGDGSQTRYAHLSAIAVRVGQAVRQGDVVGRVGSTGAATGPHLHFELRFDGRAVNPLDYVRLAGN